MSAKLVVLVAIFCCVSSRFGRADNRDAFVRACKAAADCNRNRVEATIRCRRGEAQLAGLAIRVSTDLDIERWRSTVVADAVREVEIRDSELTSRGLRRLAGFPNLRRLSAPRFVTQSDIEAISGLQSLADLDLSYYSLDASGINAIGRFRAMPRLRRLRLFGVGLRDATIKNLLPLTGLWELDLSGNEISGKGLEELAHLADIRTLRLGSIDAEGIVALNGLRRLEQLETGIKASGQRVVDLSLLQSLHSLRIDFIDTFNSTVQLPQALRRLKLRNREAGQLDLRAARHITAVDIDLTVGCSQSVSYDSRARRARDMRWLRQLPDLSELTLEMLSYNEDGEAVAALGSLRSLTIVSCETPPPFSAEAVLRQLDGLKELDSFNVGFMNSGFAALRKHPRLRQLARVGLGPESLDCVLSLRALRDLSLVLGPQERERSVGKMLARLGDLPELQDLALAETVTNDELATLASLKKLRRLDLRQASGFDATGIALLVGRLPNLQEVKFTLQNDSPKPGTTTIRRISRYGH